ncbi:hypothetical protein Avbf_15798 [Armadillidium vulgare]|nr:hypothetical protein Avbf_15798 [Armadillidium vulgare]
MEDIELSLAVTISDETTILRSIFKEVQNSLCKFPKSKYILLQNVFLVNIHRFEKILRQKLLSKCVKIWEIIYTSSHPDYSFVVKSLGKYAKYQRSIHTMLYTLKL